MAIIYSYPTVIPTANDLVLGTDVDQAGKPTKNFTIQSIVDIVAGGAAGLGAVLAISPDALQQSATNFVNVQGTGVSTFNSFTTIGGVNIAGTTGVGFTAFTSTIITGTLQTGPQPNITSLGTQVAGVVVNSDWNNVAGTYGITGTAVATNLLAAGYVRNDFQVASTKAIMDYIASTPNNETLAQILVNGNVTGGTDIAVSAADDITFTDTSKIIMGSGADTTIEHNGTDFKVTTILGKTTVSNSSDDIDITASATGKKVNISGVAGVDLKHNGSTKLQVTGGGVEITGTVSSPTGSNTLPSYTFIGDTNTGVFLPAADTVGLSGGGVLGLTVDATDTSIEGNLTVLGAFSSLSAAQATFGGKVTVSTPTVGTDAATKAYVDSVVGGKTLEYAGDATGPFALNLATDDLEFNGDSNISVTAAAVNATKGIVTIDLNDNVTITGTMQAGTLSDGTFSGTAGTYTGGVSITSTDFVGALTGNASTATALATTGTINMTSAAGATLGPTASAVTYTSGGNISLVSVLPASTVTSKLLTGVSFSTGTAVVATDTILEGVGKLQKQITDLPAGLDYVSIWDARNSTERGSGSDGGDPDLRLTPTHVPGQYYIVATAGSATPNGAGTQPSEWKVGDWCIRGDADNDVWQKIDNTSEVTTDGSGVAGTMPVWNNASELGSSQVKQSVVSSRTVTTIVDGGTGGDLTVEGNTLLGSASTDTINSVGVHTIDNQLILKKGLGVGATPDYGDTTNKVLVSGNGSANPPAWVNRSTWGYVESVSGGTGITVSGTAIAPIVNVDYLGTDNAILSATAYSGTVIPLTNQIWFNDENAGANTLSYAPINQLPFDDYAYWTLSDDTNTVNIAKTNTAKILGSSGITSVVSPTDKSATLSIDYVGADNAILSAGTGTPIATDELLFNNADVASGTVQRATIASIVDLGNETLAQVLANDNVTGGTKILVNANDASGGGISLVDDAKIRFSTNGHMQIYGTGTENRIYNNGAPLRISVASGSVIISKDLGAAAETMAQFTPDGSVDLYYDGLSRFKTTATGVEIVNTDTSVPPTILLNQDSNNFIITQSVSGGGQITNSSGSLALRNDASINLQNKAGTYTKASFDSSISFSPDNLAATATVPGVTIYQSTDATADGTRTRVYGDLQVDGNIINEGGSGGIFNGNKDIDAGGVIKVFTLTRATTGCLVFDVFFTADFVSGIGGGPPIAEKWTVVHGSGQTPVYNKIISNDGQFGAGGYDVTFADASSGTAVECSVAKRSGSSYPSLSYTIIVGHSENNALTFTPA